MTAVVDDRAGPPPPGPESEPSTDGGRPPGAATPRHLPAAEVCLTLVTLAMVSGFGRVFSATGWIGPLVTTALVADLFLAFCRRRDMGLGATALASIAVFLVLASWLFFIDTTKLFIPTPDTARAAGHALSTSWGAFQQVVAPTTPQPGFLLAAAFGVFFAAFLADWAAFRLWAPLEALVPSLTLFGFTSFVGSARAQVGATVVYSGAALLFVLEHRVTQRERTTGWLAGQIDRGSSWLVRTGLAVIAVAVVVGGFLGPHLPGAGDSGVVHWHNTGPGAGSRSTVTPLVSVRSKLTDQANSTLFVVTASKPSYWRLTSLDTFDGNIWKSSETYDRAQGRLPDALPKGISQPDQTESVKQTFQIVQLQQLWVPAAYLPVAIHSGDFKVRYSSKSSTLIVDNNLTTSDNQTYTVTSDIPHYTAAQLRAADPAIPKDIAAQDLSVPGLSQSAANIAATIVHDAGAKTAYDKAKALQDYFRSSQFTYDTNVKIANDVNAIDEFLADKHGFCQQFAGTFAALARSLGLPTRVAVGFTPGETTAGQPNRYEVKGGQAHAWPEVYLGQYGWVPFEPTPGVGAPNESSYLHIPYAQRPTGDSPTTTLPTSTTATPSTTTPARSSNKPLPKVELASGNNASGTNQAIVWATWLLWLLVALLVVAMAYVVFLPTALAVRVRQRRHQASGHPDRRVRLAWLESEEALDLVGERRRPDETAREFATRAGGRLPTQADPLTALAGASDSALFGAGSVDEATATWAEDTQRHIREVVVSQVSWRTRLRSHFDARHLRAVRRRA